MSTNNHALLTGMVKGMSIGTLSAEQLCLTSPHFVSIRDASSKAKCINNNTMQLHNLSEFFWLNASRAETVENAKYPFKKQYIDLMQKADAAALSGKTTSGEIILQDHLGHVRQCQTSAHPILSPTNQTICTGVYTQWREHIPKDPKELFNLYKRYFGASKNYIPFLLSHLKITDCFFSLPTENELKYLIISDCKSPNTQIAQEMQKTPYNLNWYLNSLKNKLNGAWTIQGVRLLLRAYNERDEPEL